jgi:hypothetical protein
MTPPRRDWVLPLARVLAATAGVVLLVAGPSSPSSTDRPVLQRHVVREVEEDCDQQALVRQLLGDDADGQEAVGADEAAGGDGQVGTRERVRITGPTGRSVEVVARIDTGARGSSMDDDLAEELEFDLDGAETVRVTSALGTQERPVVMGQVRIAGQVKQARLSVADRKDRSAPVLIGRRELVGLQVLVSEEDR